ncbi:MAG: hypothetical protein ACI89J_000746, partial [Hyphomicrobiaceae bacterium]
MIGSSVAIFMEMIMYRVVTGLVVALAAGFAIIGGAVAGDATT